MKEELLRDYSQRNLTTTEEIVEKPSKNLQPRKTRNNNDIKDRFIDKLKSKQNSKPSNNRVQLN
jgi:hypothetical protein